MINVSIKNNIKFPKILLQDDLQYIADKIFIPTMQKNINAQIALDESPLPPLELKTVLSKRKKGLSEKILTATGKLRTSFFSFKSGKSKVIVTLKNDRKDIGKYLQVDGVGKKKKHFNFFGISTRMENSAINYMKKRLKEIIYAK